MPNICTEQTWKQDSWFFRKPKLLKTMFLYNWKSFYNSQMKTAARTKVKTHMEIVWLQAEDLEGASEGVLEGRFEVGLNVGA